MFGIRIEWTTSVLTRRVTFSLPHWFKKPSLECSTPSRNRFALENLKRRDHRRVIACDLIILKGTLEKWGFKIRSSLTWDWTTCRRDLEMWTVPELIKVPTFMEPGGSLPHLQDRASCPYPEPDESSPCLPSHFLKVRFNVFLPFTLASSKWSQEFPTETPCAPVPSQIRATCPAHLILYLTTRIMLVRYIDHEAHYAISSRLLLPPYSAQISSSAPSSRTHTQPMIPPEREVPRLAPI